MPQIPSCRQTPALWEQYCELGVAIRVVGARTVKGRELPGTYICGWLVYTCTKRANTTNVRSDGWHKTTTTKRRKRRPGAGVGARVGRVLSWDRGWDPSWGRGSWDRCRGPSWERGRGPNDRDQRRDPRRDRGRGPRRDWRRARKYLIAAPSCANKRLFWS